MRAVARTCLSFALLALVAVSFLVTVRVCGVGDARAGEPQRVYEYGLPVSRPSVNGTDDGGRAATEPQYVASEPDRGAESATAGAGTTSAVPVAGAAAEPGDIEMHNLAVWDSPDGSPNVFVSFTPISTDSYQGAVPFRRKVVDGEEVEVADVAPVLDEEHVRIELDGEPVEVASLQWYYAGYGDLGGADMKYMSVCLVRVLRPELSDGEHELRVTVEDAETGEVGEGVTTFQCQTSSARL